jgi:hypothetical protein
VIAALENRNSVLSEQLRDFEGIGTRMRDEITALRGLVGSGEGTDAEVKVHAAELVHELAEVSKERDDLRAQWDELKGLYRDKVWR